MARIGVSKLVKFQPRSGQTPSKATLAKLSTATYKSGTLRQGGNGRAPDGGAIADYPKGWRFLPVPHNSEAGEILKKNPRVVEAMSRLHNLSFVPSTMQYVRDPNAPKVHQQKTEKYQKVIADAHYNLVIAPQIKAEKEQKEREEEEQRQTIATLKMRVQELEKPIYEPIPISTDRSWSNYAILGIGVVIFLIFLRRRA